MKQLLWVSLVIMVGSYISLSIGDPDLWWHITIGRWIVSHHTVPSVDYWNMFSGDKLWRAYSWSNEVLLALVDQWAGEKGLLIFQILLACSLAGTLFYIYGRIARDYFVGSLLGIYGTVACFNHFTLRPQAFVWILFAATIGVADAVVERGISKKRLVVCAVLGCIWANSHLTAVLGLAALFLWSVQDTTQRVSLRRAIILSLAFFAGTLITPYYGGEWLTFIAKGGHPLQYNVISEFQPATILQYSTVFVVLLGVLLVVACHSGRALPTLGRIMLGGGMTLAGLTALKFLPFAAIALCAIFAVWWRQCAQMAEGLVDDNVAEGLRQLRAKFLGLQNKTVGALAFFVLVLSIINIRPLLQRPVAVEIIPKTAVDFINQHNLPHPILNEFGTGGYLMYRYSTPQGDPIHKVSIDGRTNVNAPEVWDLYYKSLTGKAGWEGYIEKVQPNSIIWRQGSPLTSLLLLSPEWCRVFASGSEDENFVVFIKRDEFNSRRAELSSIDCS